MKREIYISIDVEADGRVPGLGSMLSFGAAAFDLEAEDPRKPVSTFTANLHTIMGQDWPLCHQNREVMDWWAQNPEAWEACRKDLQEPSEAMPKFVEWIRGLPGHPVIIGYPVTYDFMWVYWYTVVFGGLGDAGVPFSFSGMDLKTMMSERLGTPYRQTSKRLAYKNRKQWFQGLPEHTHIALEDAIGQGILFVNIKMEK